MNRALFVLIFLSFAGCGSSDSSDETPGSAGGAAGTGSAGQGGAGASNGGNAGQGGAGGGQAGGGMAGGGMAGGGMAGGEQAGGGMAGGGQAGGGQAGSGQAGGGQAGGGNAGSGQAGGGMAGGGGTSFALTSTGVTEGAAFPAIYTCAGQNISPPLAWAGAPAASRSYAVVLTDTSNQLIHWAIWDIPATVSATPEGVETTAMPADPAGAIQVKSYDNKTYGYLGPCPNGQTHTYQFALHALDTEVLPGVTSASTRPQVEAAILAHSLGKVTLTGNSNAAP